MSKNKNHVKKEKLSKRIKNAYQRGYLRGFEDSASSGVNVSRYFGKKGYSKGYGDKRTVTKIERKYARYKSELK